MNKENNNLETENKKLKSVLNIVKESCEEIIEQSQQKKDKYWISEEAFLKLKGNLQFIESTFGFEKEEK